MSIAEYCQASLHQQFFSPVLSGSILGLWVIHPLGPDASGSVSGGSTLMVWI